MCQFTDMLQVSSSGGVKQGCVLLPISFLMYIEEYWTIVKNDPRGVFVDSTCEGMCLLLFADDVIMFLLPPILMYGSQVWSIRVRKDTEIDHTKFCKYILWVDYHTSDYATFWDECGCHSMTIENN